MKASPPNEQTKTYSVPQAAKILGIGQSLAYELANKGEIRVIRLGKRLLVNKDEVERILGSAA